MEGEENTDTNAAGDSTSRWLHNVVDNEVSHEIDLVQGRLTYQSSLIAAIGFCDEYIPKKKHFKLVVLLDPISMNHI